MYLLLSTESRDAHNERNLVRVFMLFKSIPNLNERYSERSHDVADAIVSKLEGELKGLPMTDTTLKIRARELGISVAA